ncbi:MAG: hypothetical protein Q8K59_07065 [Nitrosomonas sp.]|nr:hypothetical protein [Nitrosomonas sp.]MDP1950837.1 hypothetical protein [Nitrosomonas sp.]
MSRQVKIIAWHCRQKICGFITAFLKAEPTQRIQRGLWWNKYLCSDFSIHGCHAFFADKFKNLCWRCGQIDGNANGYFFFVILSDIKGNCLPLLQTGKVLRLNSELPDQFLQVQSVCRMHRKSAAHDQNKHSPVPDLYC